MMVIDFYAWLDKRKIKLLRGFEHDSFSQEWAK